MDNKKPTGCLAPILLYIAIFLVGFFIYELRSAQAMASENVVQGLNNAHQTFGWFFWGGIPVSIIFYKVRLNAWSQRYREDIIAKTDWNSCNRRIAEIVANIEKVSYVKVHDADHHQTLAEVLGDLRLVSTSYGWRLETGISVEDRFAESYGIDYTDKYGGSLYLNYPYPRYESDTLKILDSNSGMTLYKSGYGIWYFYLGISQEINLNIIKSHLNKSNPYINKILPK